MARRTLNPILPAVGGGGGGGNPLTATVTGISTTVNGYTTDGILKLVIPPGIEMISGLAYVPATEFDFPSSLRTIGPNGMNGVVAFKDVLVLPEGLQDIGNFALVGWSNAAGLVLPTTLATLGNSSFSAWSSATSLLFKPGIALTSIGSSAFSNWSNATQLVIPEGITTIATSAFSTWPSALLMDLPSTLTSIAASAFSAFGPTNVANTVVRIRATTPPTLANVNAFGSRTYQIRVPPASVAAYKAAPVWASIASRIIADT